MDRRHFLKSSGLAGLGLAAHGGHGATPNAENAPTWRARWLDLLGPFPGEAPSLQPELRPATPPVPGLQCFHVSFQAEPGDRVTAWLLMPEGREKTRGPAMVCPHSTTHGAGKDRIAGFAGANPGDPPDPPETSRAYGLELARWGYVTLSIDLICDGERVPEGLPPYNTQHFYERHPEWSAMGKIVWDIMRSIDFLETLDYVDPARIGCVGHSLGGQSTLFSAAFDRRIAAAVTNGGMLSWVRDTDHWARPPDPQGRSVHSWVYIPRFRPYIEDPSLEIPVDFEHLMMMAAPRPLLVMSSEGECAQHNTAAKVARAAAHYRKKEAGDAITLFTYPGGHNYPPAAKRLSFAWLDRWLGHTPALPTIWPGKAV